MDEEPLLDRLWDIRQVSGYRQYFQGTASP